MSLTQAIKILRSGGVIVYPTETVYGLGCDPFNKQAIERVYQIKGRDFNKPLPLIADSIKTVEKYFILNKKEKELVKKFWPGALTLILKSKLNKNLKLQLKNRESVDSKIIAVRVSANKIACDLAKGIGGLIVSTSANLSGQKECRSHSMAAKQFSGRKFKPDLILDAGVLPKSKPSTIVEVFNNQVMVLRPGAVGVVGTTSKQQVINNKNKI